jgi:hypothetical protein
MVTGGYTPKVATGWMWDLTVTGDHDFYVLTVTAHVLVHNDDCTQVARSKVNLGGGNYKTRNEALAAAEKDLENFRYGNMKAVLRMECRKGCHIHVDVYNKRGQLIQTIHYNYQPNGD